MNILAKLFGARRDGSAENHINEKAANLITEHGKNAISVVMDMIEASQAKAKAGLPESHHLWALLHAVNANLDAKR